MTKKTVAQKNLETLEKTQVDPLDIIAKQEEVKKVSAQTVLDKYSESDEEYQAHLQSLREKDFVNTTELKLKNINIPGHRTIWASTDPKAQPSILTLKSRGYRVVPEHSLVPTGSTSVEGAGFHVLMACPEDIALKRELGLKKVADDAINRVLQEEKVSKDSKNSYLYQKNYIDEGFTA